jgi:hypothetical protein
MAKSIGLHHIGQQLTFGSTALNYRGGGVAIGLIAIHRASESK